MRGRIFSPFFTARVVLSLLFRLGCGDISCDFVTSSKFLIVPRLKELIFWHCRLPKLYSNETKQPSAVCTHFSGISSTMAVFEATKQHRRLLHPMLRAASCYQLLTFCQINRRKFTSLGRSWSGETKKNIIREKCSRLQFRCHIRQKSFMCVSMFLILPIFEVCFAIKKI